MFLNGGKKEVLLFEVFIQTGISFHVGPQVYCIAIQLVIQSA